MKKIFAMPVMLLMLSLPDVRPEMFAPEYFIERSNAVEIIANHEQIEKINRGTAVHLPAKMHDLDTMPISEDARYGFFVRRTNIKFLPTDEISSDTPGDLEYDELQYSSGNVAEPLVAGERTSDDKWAHVYVANTEGWVKTEDIAVCRTKREWQRYKDSENFLIVTGNKFSLERSEYSPAISGLELHLGVKLPLVTGGEVSIEGRVPYANHIVLIPTRGADGFCKFEQAPIPFNRDVNIGYLPYTVENLVRLMYKKLGDRYGWGGMLDADDCSGYVIAVYRCFGFSLPRNSSEQAHAARVTDLSGMPDGKKAKIIRTLVPGALLYFKGHIMMLLGSVGEKIYVISAVGSFVPDKERIQTRTVVINSLNMRRANGNTWLHELLTAVELRP